MIKDWKKTKSKLLNPSAGIIGIIYERKTPSPDGSMMIALTYSYMKQMVVGIYRHTNFDTDPIYELKYFKTKSLALKYAKSYMKKH